jgi:hypothetical protein
MRWINVTILTILTLAAVSASADTLDQDSTIAANRLISAEAAKNLAMLYSGLSFHKSPGRDGPVASVNMITYVDTTTPYIHATVNGRRAWLITLENVVLKTVNTDSAFAYARPQRIEIVIDSLTGQLLTIRGQGKKMVKTSDVLPVCSANDAERALEMGREKYVGFASEIPKFSLWEAINGKTPIIMAGAERSNIHLILYQRKQDEQPRVCWLIQLRGLPPDGRKADIISEERRRNLRYLIDVHTGETLMCCNFPQYKQWKEE